MNPKAGYGDLATIAHYAAESSTGTNKDEEYKFAYPNLPFDVIGGRAMKRGPDPDHRQQPGHGRRLVRQGLRRLLPSLRIGRPYM